jgi:tRNA 2-thiouridine synthesizing protein C
MSLPSLAIISRHPPHGTSDGQEALDLALVSGTFGQPVTLFFIGDGIYQLLKHQQPAPIGRKDYSKTFAALDFYDVSQPVVCTDSLARRGINAEDLCIQANLQSPQQWRALLASFDHIVNF